MASTTPADRDAVDAITLNLEHARILAGFLAERLEDRAEDDDTPDDHELSALALIAIDIRDRLQRITDDAVVLTNSA